MQIHIVEIDESAFDKKAKYGKGRRRRTRWVFGIIERGTGIVYMVQVKTRDKKTLTKIIQDRCNVNATIISDMWKAYHKLGRKGYRHYMVNHSYSFVDRHTFTINTT